jgi:hypothetical protein
VWNAATTKLSELLWATLLTTVTRYDSSATRPWRHILLDIN